MSDEPTPQSNVIPILIVFILIAAVAGVLYAKHVRDGGEAESGAIKSQCPCSGHLAPAASAGNDLVPPPPPPPVADAGAQ